ncbi:MAG: hypothetical protein ACJZ47_04025 [bacterium]
MRSLVLGSLFFSLSLFCSFSFQVDSAHSIKDIFVLDVSLFSKTYQGDLDVLKLADLMKKIRQSNASKESVQKLKTFMMRNKDFRLYYAKAKRKRESRRLEQMGSLQDSLKIKGRYLMQFSRKNITSPIAAEAVELVNKSRKILKRSGMKELIQTDRELISFMLFNKLNSSFGEWKKSQHKVKKKTILKKKQANVRTLLAAKGARFIKKGNKNDVLVMVNLTPQSRNARLGIDGIIRFSGNKANACRFHKGKIQKKKLAFVKQKVHRLFQVRFSSLPQCDRVKFLKKDLILIRRDAFLTAPAPYAGALLTVVLKNSSKFKLLVKVASRDYEAEKVKRKILARQIESDIEEELRRGYGMITLNNRNTQICAVVKKQDVHRRLLKGFIDITSIHTLRKFSRTIFSSNDKVFSFAQKGQCGALYANEDGLRKFIKGLKTISVPYNIVPLWLSPKKFRATEQAMKKEKKRNFKFCR